jgi:glucose/arabinose dehydrogenase
MSLQKFCILGFALCVSPLSTVSAAEVNQLTDAEARSGWTLLFDGKTTGGWKSYNKEGMTAGWKVTDGELVRAESGAGDIVSEKEYEYFEISLDYRIAPGGNSGLMFHVVEGNRPPWHTGPEVQILDNAAGKDGQKAGWLYQLYRPSAPNWAVNKEVVDATLPAGSWNQLYLRVAKDQCEVVMNGMRYYSFRIGDRDWTNRLKESKFANLENFAKAGKGRICLQDHGDVVAFRNIKLREIAADGSVPQPITGKLNLDGKPAFPNLQWEGWEGVDESGRQKEMRILELTYARDGSNRLYAAEQSGPIYVFENRSDVKEGRLFLDLTKKVVPFTDRGANEEGLLGLAMHPNYKTNGEFFVYYSDAKAPRSVLSRFRVSKDDPLRADPNSEEILLEIPQPYKNHNGGSIEFGPDGYLYIGMGDGGDRNDPHGHGQNLGTLLGSILRIDVNSTDSGKKYGIPADNPFVGKQGALPEIFAYGLRNPWRLAFDSKTGDLWAGDVGQELWEEVLLIEKGGNYGWNNREGTHPFGNRIPASDTKYIDPVWEYDHRIGKSITGGRVYRSNRVPQLQGKYLYADYVTGRIWALGYDTQKKKVTENVEVVPNSIPVLAFGEDQNGEVYYMKTTSRGDGICRFE